MLGWLWRMIVGNFCGCSHKWKIIEEGKVYSYNIFQSQGKPVETGKSYILQCEHCGDIKHKEVGV